MKNWKAVLLPSAVALAIGMAVAWAAQTNYLGTVFIADTTTPANQLTVNADGSINATVISGGGVPSIAGTANQITETGSPGATTLSIPSDFRPPGTVTIINSDLSILGSSTGKTTVASANAGATDYTATLQANSGTLSYLDLADQTLSGGANVTSANLGTKSSGTTTIDCGTSPLQYLTNGGAFTLAAPANDGSCAVQVTNNGSAGTITPSGFTVGADTGAVLDTTNGHKFIISIVRINGSAIYTVIAQQ